LQEYFASIGWDASINWEQLTETKVGPVFQAILNAPDEIRAQINRDFRQINEMATEGGIRTIIEEGAFRGLDLGEELKDVEGLHDKVFHVFLDHPAEAEPLSLLYVAQRFNGADNLPGRSWRKRSGVPEVRHAESPDSEAAKELEEGRKRLEEALSSYYQFKEGRGYRCVVDHFHRGDRLYWFAYVQDYAEARLEYGERGLERRTCKPAFEVIFVHSNAGRSLDIYVKGDRSIVAELPAVYAVEVEGVPAVAAPALARRARPGCIRRGNRHRY